MTAPAAFDREGELACLARLRAGKIKLTANRRRVLDRFLAAEGPWTLGSLHKSLSSEAPCDESSVYRALEALRDAGVLEEFRLPGERSARFALLRQEGRPEGPRRGQGPPHHHHIVCQDCGRVGHLDLCLPAGWMGKVEGRSGYRITGHALEFRGVCGECR